MNHYMIYFGLYFILSDITRPFSKVLSNICPITLLMFLILVYTDHFAYIYKAFNSITKFNCGLWKFLIFFAQKSRAIDHSIGEHQDQSSDFLTHPTTFFSSLIVRKSPCKKQVEVTTYANDVNRHPLLHYRRDAAL